nr:dihydrolipoyl dehydrogenase [Clostridium tetani]
MVFKICKKRGVYMIKEIKLEKLFPGSKEGKVGKIHKSIGEGIKSGEVLMEVEGKKGNIPVKAKEDGKIHSVEIEEGAIVKIGDVLLKIEIEEVTLDEFVIDKDEFAKKSELKSLECDVAILGAGPGGYVAAIQAAKLGAKVVLVEKDKVGGTCLNRGCIPTKAFVRSSEIYSNVKNSEKYGISLENPSIDIKKVVARKDNIVDKLVGGIQYLIQKHNIELISGNGKLIDKNTIETKDALIKAKNIVIASGSKASVLPIKGSNLKQVITSEEALDLKELPEKIAIIGGGVIGMEFAFIYANMGVEVSVIEYFDNVLSMLDEDVIKEITDIGKEKGIKFYTNSKVEEILEDENEGCIVKFTNKSEEKFIFCDKVLMSVGRQPYMENMGVEELGIELNQNKRGIKVNTKMETSVSDIYAIGDVTNVIQLAHVASHQGIVAVKNIMGKDIEIDYSAVPSVIFTEPEIAVVGVCEKIAKENNLDVEVGKFPFSANGKALTLGEDRGFIKVIKEKATGKVVGASIIGAHASDLIAELTLAVKNGLTSEQIAETIHAHPTTAEVVHEASLAVEGGALHFAE